MMPPISVEIFLVPYGYQVDIYDRTWTNGDANGTRHSMECKDFGGDYRLTEIAACVTDAILKAMQGLERNYLRNPSPSEPAGRAGSVGAKPESASATPEEKQ
jgi:hypothetical protein